MKNSQATIQDFDQTSLRIGDVVFIRIDNFIFNRVAKATLSWTNHVGIIIGFKHDEYWVAESTIPFSRIIPLSKFIARSQKGSFVIARLKQPLSNTQKINIMHAAKKRMGILYDTGFNLRSGRQFCSRFVYEVIKEATNIELGEIESFRKLLHKNPEYGLGFWKIWFLGFIPWQRLTVTPASQFNSKVIELVYDYRCQE
ncbi:YebB family permuted papain-like enzyme [Commensalibacter communis]|uniref:YebB family permuted papain-like enzyme n=1 Tax=Commensalibacter communis TaxID=2972786 RepID=UPI0022FF97FC|nr:YebB family permuted papain-like enzyme [Commensalibacter communis]CAI3937360.1 unnamed protein product [Commensalibacter communis]CAI3940875.1 unnamed protein product [Commensalibacter communis]